MLFNLIKLITFIRNSRSRSLIGVLSVSHNLKLKPYAIQFAFEGMLLAVYKDRVDLTCPSLTTASPAASGAAGTGGLAAGIGRFSACPTPDQILQYLEVESSFLTNIIALLVHIVVLRLLCYIALRFKLREPN